MRVDRDVPVVDDTTCRRMETATLCDAVYAGRNDADFRRAMAARRPSAGRGTSRA